MTDRGRAPSVDIVIVDYNAGEFVRDCLRSVAASLPELARIDRIVVVDNASRQPTAEFLPEGELPVHLLRNSENRGFAAACNQGAAGSSADYILFLNPDTTVNAKSIDKPVAFLEDAANSRVGIVGIQLVDQDGNVARTCSYYPRLSFYVNKLLGLDRIAPGRFSDGFMLGWDHASSREVEGVMGAFFLVRRKLFELLGGFDGRFFVYFEETDFGVRAARAGYSSYFLADARIFHHGCGSSDKVRRERLAYFLESRLKFGLAHFGKVSAGALVGLTLFAEPLPRLARTLWSGSRGEFRDTVLAYGDVWRSLGRTLRSSSAINC